VAKTFGEKKKRRYVHQWRARIATKKEKKGATGLHWNSKKKKRGRGSGHGGVTTPARAVLKGGPKGESDWSHQRFVPRKKKEGTFTQPGRQLPTANSTRRKKRKIGVSPYDIAAGHLDAKGREKKGKRKFTDNLPGNFSRPRHAEHPANEKGGAAAAGGRCVPSSRHQ